MNFPGIRCKRQSRTKCNAKAGLAIVMLMFTVVLFVFSTAYAASGGSEHGAEPKGWVSTDTYRVMNFAVLAIGLFILLRKPVSNALNARIKGIKNQLDELEAKKAAAETELAKYEEKLTKLESEAEKIIEEYKRQGEEAKARILKEAESAAEKLEEHAKRNIEQEFEQAKNNLRSDVLEDAMAKAEDMIKVRISTDDQERLVDEYLDKVVA